MPRDIQLIRDLLIGKRRQSFDDEPFAQGMADATLSLSTIITDNSEVFKVYGFLKNLNTLYKEWSFI